MFDLGRPSKKCVKVVEFFKAKNKAFHLPIHWMPDAGYRIPVAEMSSEVVLTLVLKSEQVTCSWRHNKFIPQSRAAPRSSDFTLGLKLLLRAHFDLPVALG